MELTAQVLRNLPRSRHPNVLAGAEHFEDAGVYRITESIAIVQTIDFFPPLVDDPYTFGRIAAANSLSDVYAMGGTPITALNVVGFPDEQLPAEILHEILRGGRERATAAGAEILGGHSVRDSEVKYGLAVTGTVNPNAIVGNNGARSGDLLILTKPIGSGILTSAAKKGTISVDALAEAIDVMTHLNGGASLAMVNAQAHAATDVTGFGFLGHAFEMAEASRTCFEIDTAAVPLMDRALELARQGILTRAHRATLAFIGSRISVDGVDDVLVKVLADAQTSGGLLISVPADRAAALVSELERGASPSAVVVGRVRKRGEAALALK